MANSVRAILITGVALAFLLAGCLNVPLPYGMTANSHLRSGQDKAEAGDYAGALVEFDQVIEGYHDNVQPGFDIFGESRGLLALGHTNRGITKAALGDYAGAVEDYDTALDLFHGWNPTTGTADDERAYVFFNRGFARLNLEDYAGALEDARAAARLPSMADEADLLQIAAYTHLGQHQIVIEALDDTIAGADMFVPSENVASTFAIRGFVKALASDETGAISDAEEAVAMSPDIPEIQLMAGVTKFLLGDHADAIADVDEALRLAAGRNGLALEALAYLVRAQASALSGNLEMAAQDFETIALHGPGGRHMQAFGALAVLSEKGQAGQHERSYAGALIHVRVGCERLTAGDPLGAREAFEKAMAIAVSLDSMVLERLAEDGLGRV